MVSSFFCTELLAKKTSSNPFSKWHTLFFLIALVSILITFKSAPSEASQVFAEWNFDNPQEASRWQTLDVESLQINGGYLTVNAGKLPRIGVSSIRPFSGPALAIFRLRTSRQGQGTIFISTSSDALLEKQFTLSGSNELTEVKVYLGDLLKPDDSVKGFAIEFPGERGEIQIDRIQFREATLLDKTASTFSKFFEFEGISIITINNIETPQIGPLGFTLVLIVLTVVVLFLLYSIFKMPLAKATLWAFFVSALIFTARMDYNWIQAWQTNTLPASRMSMDERISFLYKGSLDEFYAFLKRIKTAVPEGESVRPATREFDNYLSKIARYYLLPVKTSECGRYIWLYNEETSFDPGSMSLIKKDKIVAAPVYPVFLNGNNGLFKRTGDDPRCK